VAVSPIRSSRDAAVMASCAVPGVFPPVMLMARNVHGEAQPYLPTRRWVDGSIADDLPAGLTAVAGEADDLWVALHHNSPHQP
jgi:predicted acylesterase/phospholipase RssA